MAAKSLAGCAIAAAMLPMATPFQAPASFGGRLHLAASQKGMGHARSLSRPASTSLSMSLAESAGGMLLAAQITLEEAVAGKGSPEVKKAAAAAVDTATQGYQEGIVPKVPMTPTILEQIMGGEDIVLTLIATITLVLGVVVTAGAGYVTFTSWQEDQYRNKLQDPESAEYKELAKEILAFEAENKAPVSSKGRAMKEALELDTKKGNEVKRMQNERMLSEPGNRDARRARAKREREDAKAMAKSKANKKKGADNEGLSSLPGNDESNKGFLDGFMDNFK